MALELNLPVQNPVSGTSGEAVRPITEGERRTVVQDTNRFGGLFGALDDLGTSVVNGISSVAGAVAQNEVNNLVGGPETTVTSEGDPLDQPGSVTVTQKAAGFFEQYKTELMIGGAVLGGLAVLYFVTRD